MDFHAIRQLTYEVLEGPATASTLSRWIQTGIFSLFVLKIAGLVLETVDSIYRAAPAAFLALETISLYIVVVLRDQVSNVFILRPFFHFAWQEKHRQGNGVATGVQGLLGKAARNGPFHSG